MWSFCYSVRYSIVVVEAVVLYAMERQGCTFTEQFSYSFAIYIAFEGGDEESEFLICFKMVGLDVLVGFETLCLL